MVFDLTKQHAKDDSGNINILLFDAMLRHQIFLQRLSSSLRRETTRILNATEEDIAAKIQIHLNNSVDGYVPKNVAKLKLLQKIIKEVRSKAWDKIDKLWDKELRDLARTEPQIYAGILGTVSPVILDVALPSDQVLAALVALRPFEGRTLKEWAKSNRGKDIQRLMDQIKIGLIQGESARVITQRVMGSSTFQGTDGATQKARNAAASVVVTAVNAVSNAARQEFFKDNSDIFTRELFVATLDGSTTPICRATDGKTYLIGKGRIPPLHFRCRSIRVAMLSKEAIGVRPIREFTKKQLIREFTVAEGLPQVRTRAKLPLGFKGKFDAFARHRMRALTGTLEAKISYQEFLTRQSRAFQDDVLGVTKARLFRRGNLTLDKFIDRKGSELTLAQLVVKERAAFIAAGLDPKQF